MPLHDLPRAPDSLPISRKRHAPLVFWNDSSNALRHRHCCQHALNGVCFSKDIFGPEKGFTDCLDMKLILSTHNVTLTKAIEEHILTRIDKLEHLDRWAINARVTLEHDNLKAPDKQFSCSVRLAVPGPDLFAEDSESNLYAAIDVVTKKLEQQIRKRQSKYKARKHTDASATKRKRQDSSSRD
jgi:putative sigma-54 modulation protein